MSRDVKLTEKNKKKSIRSFRRIFSLAKPHWKTLVVATFFLLIGSGMGLLFPQAIRVIIDGAMANGIASIDWAAYMMLIIFFIQGVALGIRHYMFTVVGHRIVTDLRSYTYKRLIQQEIGFFDQRKTGELMSRLSSDATVLQNTVSVNISAGLRSLAATVGGVGLLFYTSARLAFLMLLVVPVIVAGTIWFGRKIRDLSRILQDALADAAEVAEETISGVRTVRSFAKEMYETKRYTKAVLVSFEAARKRTLNVAIIQSIITFAGFATIALVLWYGGRLVVAGQLTIGDLTSFILYTLIVAFSLTSLGALFTDFMRAMGAAERLFELLDREPMVNITGGEKLEKITGSVAFDQVNFAYPTRPEVPALTDISLRINPGEIVALVGPSGSGKSTIASLIPRFYDTVSGQILIDDVPISNLDPTWLRDQIGTVSQEPILFSTSIAENIGYGRRQASQEEIVKAAKIANAHDFIHAFPDGYETQVGERGIRLSGGQKQRVAIARAALKNPAILILDEATSALDTESEFLVKEALIRIMSDRTTLIIAHRLSTVKDADRVVVLNQGRIVESGHHDELMSTEDGLYRKLVDRQLIELTG